MSDCAAAMPTAGSLSAVVLAGGFGTRIQHLSGGLPKPMIPVAGRPFLEWVVRYLAQQGVHRVVLSIGFRGEVIEQHFATQSIEGISVRCSRETEPLGTAGGFLNAVKGETVTPGAWLVLNGDSLALAPLSQLLAPLQEPEVDGAIMGVRVADAARFGTLRLGSDGRLAGFDEKRPGAGVISAGVYALRPELLRSFPERLPLSFEVDVFPSLTAASTKLKVFVTDAPFLDIGTPETLPMAEAFVRGSGLLPLSA